MASNNIRRLKDSGHETDYTGGFRLGDDGKLIPVMGIRKKQAKNNIRKFKRPKDDEAYGVVAKGKKKSKKKSTNRKGLTLAKATNKLSLPHLDKKIKNKKYLDNDEKLRRKYGWA